MYVVSAFRRTSSVRLKPDTTYYGKVENAVDIPERLRDPYNVSMIPTGWRASSPAMLRHADDDTLKMIVVLTISGIGGFHAGMMTFPDWQVAVETAQVVSGLVKYPPENPFYLYHVKLWTVLHQVFALLLLSGASEIALSRILSGLLGMVSVQALAMIVYALSRAVLPAIGTAFLIVFTRTAEYGVSYPIYLMGTSHTYGVIGLSMCALIAGLLGAGSFRTGGFLLGIAPAVHPSLGAWFLLSVVVASAWHFRRNPSELWPALKYVLAGGAVSTISLLAHLALSRGTPGIDPALSERYLASFVAFWDAHRQPASLSAEGTKLNVGTLALAMLWLKLSLVPRPAALLLRIVVVTASLSLALQLVAFIPPAVLPSTLLILMPGRLVNLTALMAVAVLMGLIGTLAGKGQRMWSGMLALYLSIGLFIGNRSMLWEWLERHDDGLLASAFPAVLRAPTRPLQILLTVLALLVAIVAVFSWRARRESTEEQQSSPDITWPRRLLTTLPRIGVLTTLAGATLLLWQWPQRPVHDVYRDRTNSAAFAKVAEGSGLLLTGGDLHLVQLRTRRPVLLDGGALDGLPYALAAGPLFDRILRDAYEIDLLSPPEEARGKGAIPNGINQATWEHFSLERWRQIRHTYRVTQVMTDPRWTLALPVAARDPAFTLYDIPE